MQKGKEKKPKKSLGQNFLEDEGIIQAIFDLAQVKETECVLEIGPGRGALTRRLAQEAGALLAIERDDFLAEELRQEFSLNGKVRIVSADILESNLPALLEEQGFKSGGYQVVANIPYYITAPIIRTLLELATPPRRMTLMVQDEVAERLAASPGQLSVLGIMAQYYARVEKKLFVSRKAFFPVPKVDSALIQLSPYRTYQPGDRSFFRTVKAGFAARRKTLANNLSGSYQRSREEIEALLESMGLRKDIRAQALSVAEWEQLNQALNS